jgi:hypothetical protein
VPKAHFTREAHITSEGNITFRLRNTSLKKALAFASVFSGSRAEVLFERERISDFLSSSKVISLVPFFDDVHKKRHLL